MAALQLNANPNLTLTLTLALTKGHVAALQLNGPCATFLLFGGASLLCFAGAVALPRSVDGPQRAALLHGSGSRSDAPVVEAEDAAHEPHSSDPTERARGLPKV